MVAWLEALVFAIGDVEEGDDRRQRGGKGSSGIRTMGEKEVGGGGEEWRGERSDGGAGARSGAGKETGVGRCTELDRCRWWVGECWVGILVLESDRKFMITRSLTEGRLSSVTNQLEAANGKTWGKSTKMHYPRYRSHYLDQQGL